jgi:Protein of unknown function (DUF1329)
VSAQRARLLVGSILFALRTVAGASAPEVGTVVGPEQVDAVADLVLPGVADAVRRGMRIEVGAHRAIPWRKAYRLATEKHGGQARLGPNGELLGYVAGLPFPRLEADDPQIAHKILWNYAFGPWGSDDATTWSFEWETGKLRSDGPMQVEAQEHEDGERSKWIRLLGRTEVPPLPALPDNTAGVAFMEIFGPTFPVFLTVLRSGPMLTYRYLGLQEDDVWYWTSWDRRTRRIPAQIRYEAFGDTVIDLNSSWGLSVPHGSYTWRYLGERRMLGVVHARRYPSEWCPGRGDFAPCEVWEERTAYLVEGTAVQPYDSYGKRVVAIDKEGWVVLATDLFDKKGARWKTWMNFWSYRPYARGGPDAEELSYLLAGSGVDFQDDKAIRWRLPGTRTLAEAVAVNTGLEPADFSQAALGSALGPH